MSPHTHPVHRQTQRLAAHLLGLLLALALGWMSAVAWSGTAKKIEPAHSPATTLPPAPAIDPDSIITVLPLDAIPAIDDPQFETTSEAVAHLKPDERVIGLTINGDARAYPVNILSSHEIVNDVVGGEPVAVTWCPLCYTALVFSRWVEGRTDPLSFGVSGKLLHNALVLFDRQSGSLWSQLYGAGVSGQFEGVSLAVYPSIHSEWAAWYEQHPDSLVLSKAATRQQFARGSFAQNPRSSYHVDPYASYYNMPDEGVIDSNIPRDDAALQPKTRVLGVRVAGQARTYPYEILENRPVINDQLGDTPILIWFDVESATGLAYRRQLDDRVLHFDADGDTLIDKETGSRWNPFTGIASAGPLAGQQLTPLPATTAFAFGWKDHFPESSVFGE